jgi:hypothetical protein
MHSSARRVADVAVTPDLTGLPFTVRYEWMSAVNYWLDGGTSPVWFLAHPGRTDLALIDPRHLQLVARYGWAFDASAYAGGARPSAVDWYAIDRPAWFLDKGWSLTPETAGVAASGGDGPGTTGSVAHIARTPVEATMMIGGRQTGPAGSTARLRVELDGRTVLEWDQPAGFFLKMHTLAAGELDGPGAYARMVVTAAPLVQMAANSSGDAAPVSLEQFDLAPSTRLVWGYGDGWMEPEFDPVTRKLWRWSSQRAILRLPPRGRAVTLELTGNAPVNQLGQVPVVTVKAGDRVIDTFRPSGDFTRALVLPDDALRASSGQVIVEADRAFVPAGRNPGGDHRALALRVYRVSVH